MSYRNNLATPLCTLLLLLCSTISWADSSTQHGAFTIHYNALQTDVLDPAVAKSYGITRSTRRGLLNIAVRKNQATNALGEAAAATVSANWTNLNGQMGRIPIREIRERNAIYYIGEFAIRNTQTLTFNVRVSVPPGNTTSKNISFRQQFFVK
jgi:hypothetical protein